MKTIKLITLVLLLVIIGTGSYFYSVNKNKPTSADDSPLANMTNPASVYCNEHGGQSVIRTAADGSQSGVCVFENGNECDEWLFFKGECDASSIPVPGTEKAIQEILANKYNKPLSEVKIIIQKEAPGFASGSVTFGQGGQGEGGMWFAVAGNQWDVVWDGNGIITCDVLTNYPKFPSSIIPECFDSQTNEMVKR